MCRVNHLELRMKIRYLEILLLKKKTVYVFATHMWRSEDRLEKLDLSSHFRFLLKDQIFILPPPPNPLLPTLAVITGFKKDPARCRLLTREAVQSP